MTSKEKVLKILEENKETYTSGEEIANALNISRNAVWKAINELKKAGYEVTAVTNKGYMLSNSSDIISKAGVEACLNKETLSDIADIFVYDTLESTNQKAKELAILSLKHGTVVISKEQTGGRGRKDHSFFSPKGGIYLSLVLDPKKLSTLEPDKITTFIGNCVCKAINELTGISPYIKPVNDLFVDSKKICGILTESGSEFETGLVQWIVVGIGINFDSDLKSFPKELKEIVGLLFKPGKASITKNQLIAKILENILTGTI